MTRTVWIIMIVGFGLVCVAAFVLAKPSNEGFTDGAAVIAFVGIAAVGIERCLELFWTLVGQLKSLGQWWPFNAWAAAYEQLETETNAILGPRLDEAAALLRRVREGIDDGTPDAMALDARISELEADRKALQDQLDAALRLAPGSTRAGLVRDVAGGTLDAVGTALRGIDDAASYLRTTLRAAGDAAGLATGILASFQDNPARRIMSILIGAGIGVAVAGFFGLNAFLAVLGTDELATFAGSLGILLTGIAIGLGSAPTHELVKSLENYKAGRLSPFANDGAEAAPTTIGVRMARDAGPSIGGALPRAQLVRHADEIRKVLAEPPGEAAELRTTLTGVLQGLDATIGGRRVVDDTAPPSSVGRRIAAIRFRRTD